MKNLIEVMPLLQTYPAWVKWLVAFWLVYTTAILMLLIFVRRNDTSDPQVTIDEFRLVEGSTRGCHLTLELLTRNTLPQTAQLVELQLAFYSGQKKPRGGLHSYASESASYVLFDDISTPGLLVGEVRDEHRHKTEIKYPFAGQEYAEISLPISQTIDQGGTDRFMICFETDQLPKKSHRNIEATIRYNGNKRTEIRTIPLENS